MAHLAHFSSYSLSDPGTLLVTCKVALRVVAQSASGRKPKEQRTSKTTVKAAPSKPLTGFGSGISIQDLGNLSTSPSRNVIDPDSVTPAEELRKVRKTKIVSTIGPTSCSRENLFRLADEVRSKISGIEVVRVYATRSLPRFEELLQGMQVVRLNMSHGDHKSHKAVVDLVKEYNKLNKSCLAVMLDTKGPEVRSGDLTEPIDMKSGETYTFTIAEGANGTDGRISVNYDGFIDDVSVGDILLVDGGLQSLNIVEKKGKDVICQVIDGGVMKSRRHLNIRGKSANLPAITDKDWLDLKFGIDVGVDYYALSFVRNADVIYELKRYLSGQGAQIGVLAKIESADSVGHLEEILDAVDGAMVARGDLGAELPVEEVPYWQNRIVQGCRKRGKPVIVATNMLESMIQNPTPTRAEVSDIAIAVREGADAIMLSGESAYGKFPFKAVSVMSTVAKRTEQAMLSYQGTRRYGSEEAEPIDWIVPPGRTDEPGVMSAPGLSEMFAYHATTMANTIRTSLLVFTRMGNMPALLSHYRPDFPIFCFTEDEAVQRRLALYHGVTALRMRFGEAADETFERFAANASTMFEASNVAKYGSLRKAILELRMRGFVKGGQQVAIVQSGRQPIWRSSSTHTIQVRRVPQSARPEE